MNFFIVLAIFATSCYAADYNNLVLRFFGTSYSDYKNLTVYENFSGVNGSYFNETKKSVLIIHGEKENYTSDVIKELQSAFATRSDYNIIMADWGAHSDDFILSTMFSLEDIADKFVLLLNKTKTAGYDLTKVYPVGFSMGAHIAGRIGFILKDQGVTLPRITGLDPTGMLYDWSAMIATTFGSKANLTPLKVLYKDDASFVDIIHTNAYWYRGLGVSIGHVDFWPNGGTTQPHCSDCDFPNIVFKDDCSLCSHNAAYKYFAESVKAILPNFPAKGCKDGTLFKSSSECKESNTANMGFYTSSSAKTGNYWLETNSGAPYSKWF